MTLLAELKRRNVIRMAGLYLVGAWLITQVAGTVLPMFDAPAWLPRSVVVLLAIGFIPALIFAWVFEVTPDGLKRDADVAPEQSIAPQTARRMDRMIIVVLVLALGFFAVDKFFFAPHRDVELVSRTAAQINAAADAEKAKGDSIAVLPFVNMSTDSGQEYFADGISEEILNVLVRIPNLKVAGRTSSFAYKGRNEYLRKISNELGVNHILEGSVRHAGDRLRITAQLVRGEDGFHLWSETYDRNMTDVFAVQDEIARSVAANLQLTLARGTKALVTATTDDIVTYERYLKARQLRDQRGYQNLRTAELLLLEAVARDPLYAPAWSTLAGVYDPMPSYAPEADLDAFADHWRDAGLAAARRAVALDPNKADSQQALGSMLASRYEWVPAFEALDRAIALAPDDANALDSASQNLRMTGYHDEAVALSLRAVEKEPRVAIFRNSLGNAYWLGGDAKAARQQYKQAMAIDPELPFPLRNLFFLDLCIGEADEALALAHAAIEAGKLPPDYAAVFSQIKAPTDAPTLVRALARLDDAPTHALVGCIDRPADAMEALIREWSKARRPEPILFDRPVQELWQDPRWKAQVRKDGVLDLWRARGFPPQCKPIGKDDFECRSPGIQR